MRTDGPQIFKHIYVMLINGNLTNYVILEYQYIFWPVYNEKLQKYS